MLATAIVRTSASLKPAVEQPLGHQRQPVLDRRVLNLAEVAGEQRPLRCPRPGPRRASCSHEHLPVNGVVKQRSIIAPRSASASWSSTEKSWAGILGVGDDDRRRRPPRPPRRRRQRSPSRARWPVATTISCAAATSSTAAGLGKQPARRRRGPPPARSRFPARAAPARAAPTPAASRRARRARGARARRASRPWASRRSRAPSRAAISTATGLIPPTARLSAIAPSDGHLGHDRRRQPRPARRSRRSAT